MFTSSLLSIAWVVFEVYDLRDQTNADRPFYLIEGEVSDQRSPRQVLWAHWAAAPSADPQYGGTRERNEKS